MSCTPKHDNLLDRCEDDISEWDFKGRGVRESTRRFCRSEHLNHVFRLKKALYGLKQAPRAWQSLSKSTKLQLNGSFDTSKLPLTGSAITLSCNTVQHSRTKHNTARYHFIKEQVENEVVELYFVKAAYQLADIFTKALVRDHFVLIKCLGMKSSTLEELKLLAESEDEE
nr:hypothetical protein [Tanacetum cinerariifolium]